jgi:high-affinity iron transporter
LSETSIPGRALHTLIGYTEQPAQMQLLVYLAAIAITSSLIRLTAQARSRHTVAAR